jgi:hypothetical protein
MSPMIGSLLGCCAHAAKRPRSRAAKQWNELAAFQMIELHSISHQPEPECRISNR